MYQTERFYFEYIMLGLPKKHFSYLIRFKLKKKPTPTVYTSESHFVSKFLGLARFCCITSECPDGVLTETLKRHALAFEAKKCVLLYTGQFEKFIGRNRDILENFYLIKKAEDN